jgi:hypothetical protein
MKYKNPEAQKEILIFNEYLINWDETIYLVEGAFDSIFIPNAIPMLGKFMSEHLFSVLYEYNGFVSLSPHIPLNNFGFVTHAFVSQYFGG